MTPIERAAHAAIEAVPGTGDPTSHMASETIGPMWREVARAAILAFLDPEDAEMVEAMARAICIADGIFPDVETDIELGGGEEFITAGSWETYRYQAIAAIAALRKLAGEEQE